MFRNIPKSQGSKWAALLLELIQPFPRPDESFLDDVAWLALASPSTPNATYSAAPLVPAAR